MKKGRSIIATLMSVVLAVNAFMFTVPVQAAGSFSSSESSYSTNVFNALIQSATDTTITVSWDNLPIQAVSYDVLLNGKISVSNLDKTEFTIKSLSSATKYSIKVRAKSVSGSILAEHSLTAYTYLNISTNYVLSADKTVGSLFLLNGGSLQLNGHTLTVTGDFKQTGGLLKMLTADDHLIIEGSFEENTMLDQTDTLKKGTIEVKGNFKRDKANARNFRSSPELKVLFSGTAGQIVDLNSCSNYGEGENYWINYNNNTGTNSVFGGLEITNTSAEGVSFVSPVYVSGKLYSVPDTVKTVNGSRNITLSPEAIIENNYWKYSLRYSQNKTLAEDMSIGGNLYIDNNTLNLAGKTLTVGGDFVMYHHTLNINSGTLDVKGDLRLQREIVANATAQPTEYGYADARFMMTNPNDKVKVGGDFYVQSYATAIADLTAGELRIAGDFNQLNPNSNVSVK